MEKRKLPSLGGFSRCLVIYLLRISARETEHGWLKGKRSSSGDVGRERYNQGQWIPLHKLRWWEYYPIPMVERAAEATKI